jgi:5-methylcytosine-specific restriction endonuclease McrA
VPQVAGTAKEPMGGTVDHLVPIVDGGQHVWSNVALAHRICNLARGSKPLDDSRRAA